MGSSTQLHQTPPVTNLGAPGCHLQKTEIDKLTSELETVKTERNKLKSWIQQKKRIKRMDAELDTEISDY